MDSMKLLTSIGVGCIKASKGDSPIQTFFNPHPSKDSFLRFSKPLVVHSLFHLFNIGLGFQWSPSVLMGYCEVADFVTLFVISHVTIVYLTMGDAS